KAQVTKKRDQIFEADGLRWRTDLPGRPGSFPVRPQLRLVMAYKVRRDINSSFRRAMPAPGDNVTLLLAQLREGNRDAANQLIPLIFCVRPRDARCFEPPALPYMQEVDRWLSRPLFRLRIEDRKMEKLATVKGIPLASFGWFVAT